MGCPSNPGVPDAPENEAIPSMFCSWMACCKAAFDAPAERVEVEAEGEDVVPILLGLLGDDNPGLVIIGGACSC